MGHILPFEIKDNLRFDFSYFWVYIEAMGLCKVHKKKNYGMFMLLALEKIMTPWVQVLIGVSNHTAQIIILLCLAALLIFLYSSVEQRGQTFWNIY